MAKPLGDVLRIEDLAQPLREEAEPFVRHLPVYDLEAAAGAFIESQVPEEIVICRTRSTAATTR